MCTPYPRDDGGKVGSTRSRIEPHPYERWRTPRSVRCLTDLIFGRQVLCPAQALSLRIVRLLSFQFGFASLPPEMKRGKTTARDQAPAVSTADRFPPCHVPPWRVHTYGQGSCASGRTTVYLKYPAAFKFLSFISAARRLWTVIRLHPPDMIEEADLITPLYTSLSS